MRIPPGTAPEPHFRWEDKPDYNGNAGSGFCGHLREHGEASLAHLGEAALDGDALGLGAGVL